MTQRPNIVLIHCHDLGVFTQAYGQATVRTPNLDALAAEGVRFARSFCTAPQCSPSRASLFTGRYPHSNGVMGLTHADFAWDLHPDEVHLASVLQSAGYETAAIGVIHETPRVPGVWGYQSYERARWGDEVADKAIDRLAALAEDPPAGPFYLYAGFIEPHRLPVDREQRGDQTFLHPVAGYGPDTTLGVDVPGYLADTPGTREELAELQGAVHWVDGQVGRILEAVRRAPFADETLVIFTTDHGYAMPRAKCNLYEHGIAVALIVRLPSRDGWHGGRVVDAMISNLDVMPTLLDLLDLPMPERVQGASFVPLLDGLTEVGPHDAIFTELTYHDYYDPKRSIRTERFKLIANFSTAPAFMDPSQAWRPRADTVVPANQAMAYHPHLELYDLEADPWELENLAGDEALAPVRQALAARLYRQMVATDDPLLQGAVMSPHHRTTQAQLEQAAKG